jgi:putative oxidoreductase
MQEPNENWNLGEIGGWKGFVKQLYRHHKPSGGALILRIALSLVFITEGWAKITGIAGTEHFFAMIGLTAHFWTYLVAYTEFIGGILILLGILTKPVCVALAIDMSVIIWGLPAPHGGLFWGHTEEFFILLTLLSLYVGGPGKYSLAGLLKRKTA